MRKLLIIWALCYSANVDAQIPDCMSCPDSNYTGPCGTMPRGDRDHVVGNYVNGVLDGPVRIVADSSGRELTRIEFKGGVIVKKSKVKDANGNVVFSCEPKDSIVFFKWYENGTILGEEMWNTHGKQLCSIDIYSNGVSGYRKTYDKSGTLLKSKDLDSLRQRRLEIQRFMEDTKRTTSEEEVAVPVQTPSVVYVPQKVMPIIEVVEFPDVEASFPGGADAMKKWISEQLVYPEVAKRKKEQGKVYIQFLVTQDGNIMELEVKRGVSSELDKEAKRIIRSMPLWIPAEKGGLKVDSRVMIPIDFKLE